jgi:hypothetical protein
MGQPDIARSKRFAEMGQNGHLPEPVITDRLSIKVAVPLKRFDFNLKHRLSPNALKSMISCSDS